MVEMWNDENGPSSATGNVVNMDGMFYGSLMNQDLASWCVDEISSEPTGFGNENGTNPVWGTCPSAPSSSNEGLVIGPSIGAGALVIISALAWFP